MHLSADADGITLRWPGDLTLGAAGGPWARVEVGGDLRLDAIGAVADVVVGGTLWVRGALVAHRVEAGAVEADEAALTVDRLQVSGVFRCARTELSVQDGGAAGVAFGPGARGAMGRWAGPPPRLPCAVEGPWSRGTLASTPSDRTAPGAHPVSSGPPAASNVSQHGAGGPPRWPGLATRELRGAPASAEQRARVVALCATLGLDAAAALGTSAGTTVDVDTVVLTLLRAYRDARRAPPPTWLRDALG
jgi:hypothetical protein